MGRLAHQSEAVPTRGWRRASPALRFTRSSTPTHLPTMRSAFLIWSGAKGSCQSAAIVPCPRTFASDASAKLSLLSAKATSAAALAGAGCT